MSYLLKKLSSKQEVDDVIRSSEDVVLVLRFGRDSDLTCMQLDEIVSWCNYFISEVSTYVHVYLRWRFDTVFLRTL